MKTMAHCTFRTAMGSALLAGLLSLAGISFAGAAESQIGETRSALEQYVETQRVISKEKRDLALAKEMLHERIDLVQREIDSLREGIAEAQKNMQAEDTESVELARQNERLKQAANYLAAIASPLEERTRQLIERLPDPVREHVRPLSQRLPRPSAEEAEDEEELSLSQRFQNVVGILNELDKFNRDITVTSEVRTLDDGTSAEVTAIYLGIAQGYYTSASGSAAGVGTASAEGWLWKAANEAAGRIAEAIAVLKNEKATSFVQLPAEIQ